MKDYTHIVQKLHEKYPTANMVEVAECYKLISHTGEIVHRYSIHVLTYQGAVWHLSEHFATETELENYIKTLEL